MGTLNFIPHDFGYDLRNCKARNGGQAEQGVQLLTWSWADGHVAQDNGRRKICLCEQGHAEDCWDMDMLPQRIKVDGNAAADLVNILLRSTLITPD